MCWTDLNVSGRRARKPNGRVTKAYAERFVTELRAKMVPGYSPPIANRLSKIGLSKLMEKSFEISSSNSARGTVQREKLPLGAFVDNTGVERVFDITLVLMEHYKALRLKQMSAQRVNTESVAVETRLNRAVHLGLIPANAIVVEEVSLDGNNAGCHYPRAIGVTFATEINARPFDGLC